MLAEPAGQGAAAVLHETHQASDALIPSHDIAVTILTFIDRILDWLGLSHDRRLEEIVYTVIIFGISLVIGLTVRWVVVFVIRKFLAHRRSAAVAQLLRMRTVGKCTHFIPPLVFFALIPFAFETDYHTLDWILRLAGVYTLVTIGIAICAVLEYAWWRFNNSQNKSNHPLKGILNVCRGVVWIIIVIISVSILIDKSPAALLAGLGAFAAALMLIFKDSILGFVAGIQLSTNDMLRVGDWIVVPSTIANGTVIDVTLTVVKVQNWDNTMVMLPPYTLVSTSFQNWRNMFAVGARMIDHNLFIDHASIKAATPGLLSSVSAKYPMLKDFIDKQQAAKKVAVGNPLFAQIYNNSHGVNGTIDTNLGLFRAYVCSYLIAHPAINSQTQDMLISMDPPQSYGVALNINCYSNQTSWAQYEAVKAEVLEHLHAAAPDFGIVVFNNPDRNTFSIDDSPSMPSSPR